ncbi:DNA breaking-rejoining enzyme [Favolaschia claudopus]|uniref:DNA breaking-rejoining enzyme n=1 Tax=Favolaschia claudopus TaxID=2862362 RepID=A0AAW0ADD6_9AGAR
MSVLDKPQFAGQTIAFNDDNIPGSSSANNDEEDNEEDETQTLDADGDVKMDDLRAVIKEVSKGVVDSTDAEYKRLIKLCEKFVHAAGFIKDGVDFFSSVPDPQAAVFAVAWIMSCCDDVGLDGKPRDLDTTADSYNHAQKMRAACTYGFGRLHGLGSIPWQKSEYSGKMLGNPSIFEDVSRYMVSLRKKNVRNGEVATSARAITPEILQALYHYNNRPEVCEIKPVTRRKRTEPAVGLILHAVHVIAFLCLLRFDEALKIQLQDIRPLTAWLACAKITQGYLFPTITVRDQIGDSTRLMKSEKFLEMFRNNLLDIGLDPYPYGTHSFRRGGCQYFASHRRWSLRRICNWGGWSMEFSSLTIID